MNFVDAAVTLLREVRGPLHVEELCRLALERGLLDSPGQAPLRSLKGRLTTELKRGPDSRVARVDDDLWELADAGRDGVERDGPDAVEEEVTAPEIRGQGAEPDPARASEEAAVGDDLEAEGYAGEEAYEDDDEDDDDDEADDDEIDDDEADDDEADDDEIDEADDDDEPDDDEDDDEDVDDDADDLEDQADEDAAAPDEGAFSRDSAFEADDQADRAGGFDQDVDDDEDTQIREKQADQAALAQQALEREDLSAEEKDLIQAYGSEAGTAQVGELVEYRDQQTADEDRKMTPELLPERRGRQREDWKARRERMREKRRERREGRERKHSAREQGGQAAPAAEPAAETASPERAAAPEAGEPAPPRREPARPASDGDLARCACEVLASIKGAQPVPVRQLAQMMRKRRLVDAEPDALWRPLKSALLADHQRRTAAGLPPRVAYRGRDLFSYRPSANAELEAAETGLETAAHRLRGATERTLAARLVELPLGVLEQVAQLFLSQTGWRDVEWIKRVDRSGYAVAREPGDGQIVMVAVRSGNQEVDRRGVGELRAGVAAKNMARGLLLAPRELGSDARAELERPGRPVSAMCGLPWVGALVDAGIGVALRTMPVAYLDAELFDRLSEG